MIVMNAAPNWWEHYKQGLSENGLYGGFDDWEDYCDANDIEQSND